MSVVKVMKCPNCEREMEKGHIHFTYGVRWNEGEHKTFDFAKGELLFYGQPIGSGRMKKAYRCVDCVLVLLNYRDEYH
jgi:hypothetical protein